MPTIACHTLGCKVNQYDTQAMLEQFLNDGWSSVPFSDEADIYLINTCTVTGTGDKKSLQLARRIKREHPDSTVILCGCLAQSRPELLMEAGADLVIGTSRRNEVVSLAKRVMESGRPLCAVSPLSAGQPYEDLFITTQNDRARAVIKIQEGCDNKCTYCIIPSVRGPVRSREPEKILAEAARLCASGYRELVITGIHLSSYGRDLGCSLSDALKALSSVDGLERIRLGSLEPTVVTSQFVDDLISIPALCPQFHLALQSGSDSVLRRMRRRYNTGQYLAAVERLRSGFPRCALTTDILTGFPGETEEEFSQTEEFIKLVGYSRIHVFPYSPRPGTPAASMPDQISRQEKANRVSRLIRVGDEMALRYMSSWEGKEASFIPEEHSGDEWTGYTPEYIKVLVNDPVCEYGVPVKVRLHSDSPRGMRGEIV